jgi:hypothetical protein
MQLMAKKKPNSAGGRSKRDSVFMPAGWSEVAEKLAEKARQPIGWYVVELLKREADAAGIPTPAAPWESGKSAE